MWRIGTLRQKRAARATGQRGDAASSMAHSTGARRAPGRASTRDATSAGTPLSASMQEASSHVIAGSRMMAKSAPPGELTQRCVALRAITPDVQEDRCPCAVAYTEC